MWEYNLGLRFSKIAKVQPNSSALIIEKNIHKFSDLDKKTNQICNWLIKKNLTLGNTICITSEKNFIVFSLMIACLKMGITYTFLDRKSPFLRLKKIIDDVNQSEIIADDVKCKHGATISQLNEEELFYMRSRGLSLAEASKLQLGSFFKEIISFIPVPKGRWDLLKKLLKQD